MSASLGRAVFITIGVGLVLAALSCGGILFLISQQQSIRSVELRGLAADRNELAATPVIRERISYFPPAARNIEYWCRPYWSGINGSFDISEKAFLTWANAQGWQLKELRSAEVGPLIRVMHVDGSDEYIDPAKASYFYKHQAFERGTREWRDFQIMYDRARRRAYFADTDGRVGPPLGDGG